ncbi:c-type cytochrome biogenesis protein CcmI [Colwellia sp. 6M3]|jgi:cytochrome c-type biogenesis protein CcmH|uniref:c-type cytochrome biogenesis protein CcmI n=1 Tax=Colwellia sp. 6M3 TaxID=2759849 RepID=UPI0015F710F9|nr:c-type cytochrome biogenesis protein CcmI [Colwellia sp. 6M3]MBA6415978.1 c-type cytochrome biogenesis protein CcmI [Colwellia sp. 6M3]|tara:strand:+ start:1863 stop:3122 length:1260 start_codon:yes stop_codon:yes gene_type:complete
MITFWLAILSLIVIALLIVWRIFSSSKDTVGAENINIRQETNVTLYHEHLAQLEADLAEGSIEQDSYLQLKAELDKTLLQDANSTRTLNEEQNTRSWLWPLVIALSVVSFSFFSYMKLGSYQLLNTPVAIESTDHSQLTPEQMLAFRLQQLEQVVADEPENAEAWFSLGQAYISVGKFDNAIAAFDKVMEQVGEHAEILGPKAQAMYYKNDQQIDAGVQRVIDQALALDSLDPATNILLGMDSFSHQDFAKAVQYWEVVLNSERPGISTDALADAVEEAKNQLRLSNESAPLVNDNKTSDMSLPHLTVEVSLASSLQEQLISGDDKTVFIYAIAADGPRMPLAAVKIKTSDLPVTIVLDDSQAMTPQMRLSSVNKVHIYAVVSMQGSVGIKSGDFKAEMLNVDTMTKTPITMEISIQVP